MCERKSSAATMVSGERAGGAPGDRGEIPLQPLVQPLEEHRDAEMHLQVMEETTPEQVDF